MERQANGQLSCGLDVSYLSSGQGSFSYSPVMHCVSLQRPIGVPWLFQETWYDHAESCFLAHTP